MKKLMIAAAIVCAAVASQASSVNWSSMTVPFFFDKTTLDGNKSYTAGTTQMRSAGQTFAYTLVVDGVGTTSGTVGFNGLSGAFLNNGLTIGAEGAISAGNSYTYTITITTGLSGEDANWDYSAATATAMLTGSFDGKSGSSAIQSGVPDSWTVTGAVAKGGPVPPGPVPEPTSGLLMLLGVAGLALRRRRA